MNTQRRPDSSRATSPDQPKAKARTKTNANGKSKEQGDHHTTDREDKSPEPKRGSRTQRSGKDKDPNDCESADNPHETPAPKRGAIHRQSKKQKDLQSRSLEISESKYEENRTSASGGVPVRNNANNADENDKQDGAKSKRQSKKNDCGSKGEPQQTAKSKSDEKTAPKGKSKKQREPLNLDKEPRLESSSEAKSTSKQHEHATKTESCDASNTREASQAPAVSVLSDRQKKCAEKATAIRALSVDDTLGKVLKTTIEKLKIKKTEQSNASSCVNDITAEVIAHLKQNVTWCE
ncbi:hypothetical protein M9458_026906, partial [Cirrhinus mrigala]